MNNKKCGILLHITSLPSQFGIGDLGKYAYDFADFLLKAKQTYWQVLPLNPTLDIHGNSPYSSFSAFAGNPILISPELLYEDGFVSRSDLMPNYEQNAEKVKFNHVYEYKNQILEKAYLSFSSLSKKPEEYNKFISENKSWILDYVLFVSIKDNSKGVIWNKFPEGLKYRDKQALDSLSEKLKEKIEKEIFVQYVFFKQWYKLKDYCNKNGIKIIGDLPIYLNYDSSDVWSNPKNFKLRNDRTPEFLAGVPPDYFSKTGQLWGNPVYEREYIKDSGFKYWDDRISHNLKLFDILRLDHFRGFVNYWEVPAGEETAVNGNWVNAPAEQFFTHLLRQFDNKRFIAEDLGLITQDVLEIRDKFEFPGMKVLQFAFGDDYPNGAFLLHNHPYNCVVYTGTHDNNTTLGWWTNECTDVQKQRVKEYMQNNKIDTDVAINWKFIKLALSSKAHTVIIPMQDYLSLGQEARMNTPSVSNNNWEWKISDNYNYTCIAEIIRENTEFFERS